MRSMVGPIGDHNLHEHLSALADGELDPAQTLGMLDYLAAHPEALEWLRTQQRIRIAAGRVVRAQTPPAPTALRDRIAAMSITTDGSPRESHPHARTFRWLAPSLAAAAVFLVAGIWLGRAAAPTPQGGLPIASAPQSPVPDKLVSTVSLIHAECSRLPDRLHAAGFPKQLSGLAETLKHDLSQPNPYPDLSSIGYRFVGAGPCPAPHSGMVHLLYRSTHPGSLRTVSVFAQPNTGQFQLELGKVYALDGPRSPFPVFAWRTDQVVYFLLADDEATLNSARDAIAASQRPPVGLGPVCAPPPGS